MLFAAIVIAIVLGGFGAWATFQRYRGRTSASGAPREGRSTKPERGAALAPPPPGADVELANSLVTERLWKLAFAAPSQAQFLEPEHAQIRDSVSALLETESLDPKYFPRRPTLMPQLMRAMGDPGAAPNKLSRIIAHDPVLTSDVLRLANSSLYRISPAPIETIQRAIVVLGVDALRGLIATAMLQPVFRATRTNFPRFPRMLWERTERAARAAEMYASNIHPQDRFEAQLVILLSALGPLVVYGAALDAYSRCPDLVPNPTLFVALTAALGPRVSLRIARQWETSPRLIAAIEKSPQEKLTMALCTGELLGTLSLLHTQNVITSEEALATAKDAGLDDTIVVPIWSRLKTAVTREAAR
jgi:HD-like signal output (HDOD) protein